MVVREDWTQGPNVMPTHLPGLYATELIIPGEVAEKALDYRDKTLPIRHIGDVYAERAEDNVLSVTARVPRLQAVVQLRCGKPTSRAFAMPIFKKCLLFTGVTVFGAACCAASQSDGAMWQKHQAVIQYFATGTSYSCDGIEDKVRQILQYVGARADMKVRAAGCDQGPFLPSHMASVSVEFYALAPAADASSPDSVPSHWVTLSMNSTRSKFLQSSDCDLVRAMKSVLSKSFTWQGLEYGTSCSPYAAASNSFAVKGAVLKADAGKSG